jgi:hypothetical protein
MLAELAACNAAFQTIKTFVQNGKSLSQCAQQIATIVTNKEVLQDKVKKKQTGFMASLKPQTANDLEEFLALEQIKEHEHNLKQLMIYQGRAGLWSDFIAYQAEARKRRKQEKLEAEKAREELIEGLAIAGFIILGFAGAAFILYLIFIR